MACPAASATPCCAAPERLSPGARQALDVAAVFPRRAELVVLMAVLGMDAGPRLRRMHRRRAAGRRHSRAACMFRHEIARHAVEAALADDIRRSINADVLKVLGEAANVPAARLVHDSRQAHVPEAVRRFGPAAAAEASALGSHRRSGRHARGGARRAGRRGDARADRAIDDGARDRTPPPRPHRRRPDAGEGEPGGAMSSAAT